MLAIVQSGSSSRERRTLALAVLRHLRTLYSRRISHIQKQLSSTESWATARYLASHSKLPRLRIQNLEEHVAALNTHKLPLCNFLESNAANFVCEDEPWEWNVGDGIPKRPRRDTSASTGHKEPLSIPRVCDSQRVTSLLTQFLCRSSCVQSRTRHLPVGFPTLSELMPQSCTG